MFNGYVDLESDCPGPSPNFPNYWMYDLGQVNILLLDSFFPSVR